VKPYRCGAVVSEHVALEKRLPKTGLDAMLERLRVSRAKG